MQETKREEGEINNKQEITLSDPTLTVYKVRREREGEQGKVQASQQMKSRRVQGVPSHTPP